MLYNLAGNCLSELHKCLIKITFVRTVCLSIFFCLFQALYPTQILHGCDANAWSPGPGGCVYSLLHKAIKLRDTLACTFLIKNGVDINSPFRPGAEWKDTVEANFAGPLHMACSIGLEAVVQCLVEHHADVNQKVCIM